MTTKRTELEYDPDNGGTGIPEPQNDPVERLPNKWLTADTIARGWSKDEGEYRNLKALLDTLEAEGRRATVERIRAAMFDHPGTIKDYDKNGDYLCGCEWPHHDIDAILDAEAE